MAGNAIIVGCGLSGITAAVLLKEKGYNVEIFESRGHIGGNCYDYKSFGHTVHKYGPHIFHTNDDAVFQFLSRFTRWKDFEYRPYGNTSLGIIPLPYSKKTINKIGRRLSREEIREVIFRDYSEKLWGVKLEDLPSYITARIPEVSQEENPTWFGSQKYQKMPISGYTQMMENMLDGITVHTGCDPDDWRDYSCDLLVFTGKIDDYYCRTYGRLPYRSLTFENQISDYGMPYFVENQNNKSKYIRIYDHSYIDGAVSGKSIITKESAVPHTDHNLPFYPMQFGESQKIYEKYNSIPKSKNVIFLGRLATYKYLDMWMAVKQAMKAIEKI